MSDYEKLKQELEALRNKCKELEDKIEQAEQDDEKFERVKGDEPYYMVDFMVGKAGVDTSCEDYDEIDDCRFNNNNYFHTAERAQEIVDKINFLLKLERFHDTFCPDYKPNWNGSERKYFVFYDSDNKCYGANFVTILECKTDVFFETSEIAKKVCDILNKENR